MAGLFKTEWSLHSRGGVFEDCLGGGGGGQTISRRVTKVCTELNHPAWLPLILRLADRCGRWPPHLQPLLPVFLCLGVRQPGRAATGTSTVPQVQQDFLCLLLFFVPLARTQGWRLESGGGGGGGEWGGGGGGHLYRMRSVHMRPFSHRGNDEKIKEWTGPEWNIILRIAQNREEWRKLVVKSKVVPQQSARLRDR